MALRIAPVAGIASLHREHAPDFYMNVIYGILSIVGWAWCIAAFAFLFFKLRRRSQ